MPMVTHKAWFTKSVKFRSSRIRCGKPTIGREFPCGFRVGFPSPLLVSSATMGVFSRSVRSHCHGSNDRILMVLRNHINCRTLPLRCFRWIIQMTCASLCFFYFFWQSCLSLVWAQDSSKRISTVLWPLWEAAMATKLSGMPAFLTDKNNPAGYCVQGAIEFGMDSRRLIQRCTKPDAKEFLDAPADAIFVCVQWWLQLADNYSNMYIYIWYYIIHRCVYIYAAFILEHKKYIDIWYLHIFDHLSHCLVHCYGSILIYLRCCWWLQVTQTTRSFQRSIHRFHGSRGCDAFHGAFLGFQWMPKT